MEAENVAEGEEVAREADKEEGTESGGGGEGAQDRG